MSAYWLESTTILPVEIELDPVCLIKLAVRVANCWYSKVMNFGVLQAFFHTPVRFSWDTQRYFFSVGTPIVIKLTEMKLSLNLGRNGNY